MTRIDILIGAALLLALPIQAKNDTPEGTLQELEARLNSHSVDDLLGPVDYEWVYVRGGTQIYPLAALQAFQVQPVRADSAGPSRQAHLDSTGHARQWSDGMRLAPSAGRPDTASASASLSLAGGLPLPFVPDDRPALGTRPPRLRYRGDQAGDPTSFDLRGVNVAAVQNRSKPARLRDIEGVQVGIQIAPPAQEYRPPITFIEDENALAQRRLMRRDLRDYYADLPTGVYLNIEVDEIRDHGDRATAKVHWHFTDQNSSEKATLHLRQTEEAWRIENAWNFIRALTASR